MASPSRAESEAQITAAVKILNRIHLNGNAQVRVDVDAYLATPLEGDSTNPAIARGIRSAYAGVLSSDPVYPHLIDMVQTTVGKDVAAITDLYDELFDDMITNAKSVNSRNLTYGAASAVTGTGNWTVLRVTQDADGQPIESVPVTSAGVLVRFTCTQDQGLGAPQGGEQFRLDLENPQQDILDNEGYPEPPLFVSMPTPDMSGLQNPSFALFSGTAAAPTAITGWTSSVTVNGTNFDFDQANIFARTPAEQNVLDSKGSSSTDSGMPASLNVKVTATLSQNARVRNLVFMRDRPYVFGIWYNRAVNSAAGTLEIHLGAQSNSVVLAAQTGWNFLWIGGTDTTKCWYEDFRETDPDLKIVWTRTGGTGLLLDYVTLYPMIQFPRRGGTFWGMRGGSTFAIEKDTLTANTSLAATDATNQKWFYLLHRRYLPSNNAGAETWVDYT